MCLLGIVEHPGVPWGVFGCPWVIRLTLGDANAKYFKVNLIFIHVLMPIDVQEKESIMSVR